MTTPNEPKRSLRPHWRKMTWVVVIFNLLMLVWVIAGASTGHASHCQGLTQQQCNDAYNTGKGIGVGLLIVLWALGDVILGVLWLVTRGRSCPACGRNVRKGVIACAKCGHDFRGIAAA